MILMLWMYISSLIVLVGAEINCELSKMGVKAKPLGRMAGSARSAIEESRG